MTPAAVDVAIVAEDQRFVDFLRPAVRCVADTERVIPRFVFQQLTRGCRWKELERLCAAAPPGILIIAADAWNPRHRVARRSHKQKARDLGAAAGGRGDAVFAVAEPSVEAWLLSDARAFREGLRRGLGLPLSSVADWPQPGTETEAKESLGRVVVELAGASLPRSGFEFADEIVAAMDLRRPASDSLGAWVRALVQRIRAPGSSSP